MRFFALIFFCTYFSFSQIDYPKDYFRSPLDIPIILAGTFGELRSNHFHSGLDIKTQGREGMEVLPQPTVMLAGSKLNILDTAKPFI